MQKYSVYCHCTTCETNLFGCFCCSCTTHTSNCAIAAPSVLFIGTSTIMIHVKLKLIQIVFHIKIEILLTLHYLCDRLIRLLLHRPHDLFGCCCIIYTIYWCIYYATACTADWSCCSLLLLLSNTDWCCFLLLLLATANYCCYLLLIIVATAYYLILLITTDAYYLLLLITAAAYYCFYFLILKK